MAVILAESVAITKSRLAKGFNGDNLNLNGKIISAEEADIGFKAAGSVKPPYIAVVASGNQKGFAAGAVAAFNDYVKDINLNKYNAEAVIGRFFDDMQAVVEKCGVENGRLSIGIVCAYDDCVVAAKSGDCHLLRFSEGELFEIALSDDEGARGYQFIDMIADGDMFALIGEEASAELDYDGIVNTFDSDADLKTMVKDFYKLLSVNARGKDCTVVLMKLKCDEERTYAAAPLMAADDTSIDDIPGDEGFDAQPPVDTAELREASGYVSDEEAPETGKSPVSAKKKVLGFIPIAVLVIILAVAAALYLSTRPGNPLDEGSSGSDVDNQAVINDAFTMDGDFNGSNGMQSVEDTEFGGDVDVPEDEGDDDETTTERQETSTRAPSTSSGNNEETTTAEPEETTTAESDETTTAEGDETTTTEGDETTTADSGETTTETPADEGGEAAQEPAGDEPVAEE